MQPTMTLEEFQKYTSIYVRRDSMPGTNRWRKFVAKRETSRGCLRLTVMEMLLIKFPALEMCA